PVPIVLLSFPVEPSIKVDRRAHHQDRLESLGARIHGLPIRSRERGADRLEGLVLGPLIHVVAQAAGHEHATALLDRVRLFGRNAPCGRTPPEPPEPPPPPELVALESCELQALSANGAASIKGKSGTRSVLPPLGRARAAPCARPSPPNRGLRPLRGRH